MTIPSRTGSNGRQHGFAMLLVIIALATVTVTTTAYLAARANDPDISVNVARGVIARSNAETGIDLATAIMQSEDIDWRTVHVDGVLIDEYDFGGGTITVTVADSTGNPPTVDSTDLVMTSTGAADGLEQIAQAVVDVPKTTPEADYDLSEFAAFGINYVEVTNSDVTRWQRSPRAKAGEPIRVGTNFTGLASVVMDGDGSISDCYMYVREDASANIFANYTGEERQVRRMELTGNDPIPVPVAPVPDVSGLPFASTMSPQLNSGAWFVDGSKIYNSFEISGYDTTLRFAHSDQLMVVLNDLYIGDGAEVIVDQQQVNIIVLGDVTVDVDAGIDLDHSVPNASIRLFVGGNLTVNDSMLGISRDWAMSGRDAQEGINFYQDPALFQVYQLDGDALLAKDPLGLGKLLLDIKTGMQTWDLTGKSWACATFYGTNNLLKIRGQSAVFGQVVAKEIYLSEGSVLHYDHVLDTRGGYTNPDSFVYADDGSLNADVLAKAVDLEESTIVVVEDYVKTVAAPSSTRNWKKMKRRYKRCGMRPKWDDDWDDWDQAWTPGDNDD